MLNGGTSFGLDLVGTVSGEGTLAAGVQLGAGVVSAAITANDSGTSTQDPALAGGGVGLSLADMSGTAENLAVSGKRIAAVSKFSGGLIPKVIKVVPFLGNAASAYSAHQDWGKMWESYNNCMEHF